MAKEAKGEHETMTQTCHGRRDLLGVALATTLGSAAV